MRCDAFVGETVIQISNNIISDFPSLFPLGSVTAPFFKSIREIHNIIFNVKQQLRGNKQGLYPSKNRFRLRDMLPVNTILPCRTVDIMNIHSQLSARQFRLPKNKTQEASVAQRSLNILQLKPDYKLLQLPGLGGDNHRHVGNTQAHTQR